jgi:hypothetical protein
MSFDPWNGRTTIRLGGPSRGDAPITTAPSRPSTPAGLFYTTVSSPRKTETEPGGLHWVVQWKPSGATPAVGWTVQHAKAPAGSTGAAEPAAATTPPAPAPAQARPTLGGSARSISRHLTATWNATGGSKPTTIAT